MGILIAQSACSQLNWGEFLHHFDVFEGGNKIKLSYNPLSKEYLVLASEDMSLDQPYSNSPCFSKGKPLSGKYPSEQDFGLKHIFFFFNLISIYFFYSQYFILI